MKNKFFTRLKKGVVSSMDYALTIENLTKNYGDFVLDNVNIKVPYGCIMGFIGENGAGKSTTIKSILNVIHKDNGNICLLGKDTKTSLNSLKENIGVVMDETCIPENLNAIALGKIMKRIYATWNKDKYENLLHEFSISKVKTVKEYSRGMKMKLQIAIALSHDSKLLIMDEATSGLDPVVREEILDVFMDFIQDENHSIFLSSHILSDLEKICDYITFIHKGKIVLTEPKDELIEKYGVLKCSKKEFEQIDKALVKGCKMNEFGVEALIYKNKFRGNYVIDKATIEDIMLFTIKEGARC